MQSEMIRPKARLEFPAAELFLGPAVDFAVSFARQLGCGASEQKKLAHVVQSALGAVMQNNAGGKSEAPVTLEFSESAGKLVIEIINRGVPLLLNDGRKNALNAAYFAQFHEAAKHADKISLENFGRKGQWLTIESGLGPQAAAKALSLPGVAPTLAIPEDETITVRLLESGEEEALSRLFYLVYGYQYINELVYYPEKIQALIAAGEMISIVAVRGNGRLVGHVGLVRKNSAPVVYEAAMGVVDPAVKSRGLFRLLFKRTMEQVRATPMHYCFIDFVTNHELTQKHVNQYGVCELALFAGCQTSRTQANLAKLGLGEDPVGMDRYSLLTAIIPQVAQPFGALATLPESLCSSLGFLLKPLGLRSTPVSRFESLPEEGSYKMTCQQAQGSVIFDLEEPGRQAVVGILAEWQDLRREGFQYAAIEVPLDRPGLSPLYEQLSSAGFFIAGFVPYRFSSRLGLRFQALGPTKVAFEKIKVASEAARKLLNIVKNEYSSNCLL